MDGDAELVEATVIMFTVITVGHVVIMGVFRASSRSTALMISVVAAFWAWALIRVKRLYFLHQRTGRPTFSLMQIHSHEILSSAMMVLILLCYLNPRQEGNRADRVNWQDRRRMSSLPLLLVGLATTGHGMGVFATGSPTVFFPADLGAVFFVAIGLSLMVLAVNFAESRDWKDYKAALPIIVYILVLLLAIYFAGDW